MNGYKICLISLKSFNLIIIAVFLLVFEIYSQPVSPPTQNEGSNENEEFRKNTFNNPSGNSATRKTNTNESWLGGSLKVIELAGNFFPTPSEGGPQSITNILNSVRISSSLVDPLENFGYIQETGSSRPKSTFSPRIKYSHQLGENFFLGLSYAENEKSNQTRSNISTNGLFTIDKIDTGLDEIGFRIGIGPLNYLTKTDSSEFSLGYSEIKSNGPYTSLQFRNSFFHIGNISRSGDAFTFGTMEYRTKNYSLGFGYSTELWDWLNFYIQGDLTVFSGKLKLSALTSENITIDTSTTTTPSYQNVRRLNLTGFESKQGFFSGFGGMNFYLEMGLVWKVLDSFGIRYGGYYQFSFFSINEIAGLNLKPGSPPLQLDSIPDLTSSLSGKEFGFWGVSIAAVKNF